MTKYATAPSLESLAKSIKQFYCGEDKEIREAGENKWTVHSLKDGRQLSTVIVLKKGRYIFGVEE